MANHEKKMRGDEMKRTRGSKKAYDSMKMFCDLINNKKTIKQNARQGVAKGAKVAKEKAIVFCHAIWLG